MTKKEETYNEAVEKLRKIVADIEKRRTGCGCPFRESEGSDPADQIV